MYYFEVEPYHIREYGVLWNVSFLFFSRIFFLWGRKFLSSSGCLFQLAEGALGSASTAVNRTMHIVDRVKRE